MKSRCRFLPWAGFAWAASGMLSTSAATYNVGNNSALTTALAAVNPGDSIVLSNGNYSGFTITRDGTATNPIRIYAANRGLAIINSGTIRFSGAAYVSVEGLSITTSGGSATIGSDTRRFAVLFDSADFCRLTRCKFNLVGQNTGTSWVFLAGNSNSNRIDHCEFGPNSVGGGSHFIFPCGNRDIAGVTPNPLVDRGPWSDGGGPLNTNMARYTRMDRNYFHDMASSAGEAIVLGGLGITGDYQDTGSIVEFNLFENCDGDPEVISVKSSSNFIRYNTIRTCAGLISLRAGNRTEVNGNFILQGAKTGGGGIKVYEKDHKVYNNYIDGGTEYPMLLGNGDAYNSTNFSHAQVFRAKVVHNTVVNAGRQFRIGHGGDPTLPPTDCLIANNIITGTGDIWCECTAPVSMTYSKNIIFGENPGKSASQYLVTDPLLTLVGEVSKLSAASPAINYADTNYYPFVTDDADGQSRGAVKDTGADELSAAAILRQPLTTNDVGPNSELANFSLAANPTSRTVNAGAASNANFTITVTTNAGFSGSIGFTASGAPPNSSVSFNPATLPGAGSTTLTIYTSNNTPAGDYAFAITGTNATDTNSTTAILSLVSTSSLVAWLNFDDNTANDSSGHNNHGTLMNGASIVTDATRGKVLLLDGANDYVDLGNGAALNLSDNNQATITAWAKLAVSQNHNTILSKGEWREAYSLVVKGDTTPDDLLWTGNDTSVFAGSSLPLNTWTHVAVTIHNDLTTFYLNGQVSGAANQDRGNAIDNTATGVSIGREQFSGSLPAGRWFFNGQLDDVRLYERVLWQAEIQSVMIGSPLITNPRITSFGASDGNLVLSGTNGVPGAMYFVLCTTNVTLPLTNWPRVATNVFGPTGNFSFTNAVSTTVPQSFYALQIP